jgi:hypothetical protein
MTVQGGCPDPYHDKATTVRLRVCFLSHSSVAASTWRPMSIGHARRLEKEIMKFPRKLIYKKFAVVHQLKNSLVI